MLVSCDLRDCSVGTEDYRRASVTNSFKAWTAFCAFSGFLNSSKLFPYFPQTCLGQNILHRVPQKLRNSGARIALTKS